MGTKYSSKSTSGYNSSPPSDDGTVTESNKVKWSTIKTKLSDVLKTFSEAINTALVDHFDIGPDAKSANYTLQASDYGKTIECSAALTLTLSDANTLGAGWHCYVRNNHTAAITIAPQTTSDTIDGNTVSSISLRPRSNIHLQVNNAANGFMTISGTRAGYLEIAPHNTSSSFHYSLDGSSGGLYMQTGGLGTNATISYNALYDGADWVAAHTSCSLITFGATGNLTYFFDSGKTTSASFTPTARFIVDNTGKLNTGIVPLDKVGVSGSFTVPLDTSGSSTNTSITHGLGTDNVLVDIMARADDGDGKWIVAAMRPDFGYKVFRGHTWASGGAAYVTAVSGDVAFTARNYNTAASKNLTIHYTILRED